MINVPYKLHKIAYKSNNKNAIIVSYKIFKAYSIICEESAIYNKYLIFNIFIKNGNTCFECAQTN